MSNWAPGDLDAVGTADELQIAAVRADASLRPYTTIWVVRVGDDLYVRSYRGRGGGWFRSVLRHPQGRIQAGGIERDVAFEDVGDADRAAIDQTYRDKYRSYAAEIVDPIVSPDAAAATLRLTPR